VCGGAGREGARVEGVDLSSVSKAMSRRRRILTVSAFGLIAAVIWFGYRTIAAVRQLPEAYAAWDTGTLLVEYLRANDDRWPNSWDDLLTVLDSPGGADIVLYGSRAGDVAYARSLREVVAVDWSFDPLRIADAEPVTRPDGSAFDVLWEGGDPNEMVREYLSVDGRDR